MKENYLYESHKSTCLQNGEAHDYQFCSTSDICEVEGLDSILSGLGNQQKLTFRQKTSK